MKAPSWLKLSEPRREGDHAVVDVAVREQVFIRYRRSAGGAARLQRELDEAREQLRDLATRAMQ